MRRWPSVAVIVCSLATVCCDRAPALVHAGFWFEGVTFALPARETARIAGESIILVPFGGQGSVSFLILATNAIDYAPQGADRAAIIDGIGRGIGRAAAHEFAHQILHEATIDATHDLSSYEYGSADRAAQYYGTLHWDQAWDGLVRTLGRSHP